MEMGITNYTLLKFSVNMINAPIMYFSSTVLLNMAIVQSCVVFVSSLTSCAIIYAGLLFFLFIESQFGTTGYHLGYVFLVVSAGE